MNNSRTNYFLIVVELLVQNGPLISLKHPLRIVARDRHEFMPLQRHEFVSIGRVTKPMVHIIEYGPKYIQNIQNIKYLKYKLWKFDI